MKIFLFLFIIYNSLLYGQSFKETRYIASLDIEQYKYGKMHIDDTTLTLVYNKPSKETISYYSDKLTITEDEETKEYSFEEYPQIQYMGLILKAIIQNDYTSLDELFTIEIENKNTILNAKPAINDTMEYIKIERDQQKIKRITIHMTNEDTIKIETVN